MPKYDTCYFWHGGCTYPKICSFLNEGGDCVAQDEDLLTYEDYLQLQKSNQNRQSTQTANQKVEA